MEVFINGHGRILWRDGKTDERDTEGPTGREERTSRGERDATRTERERGTWDPS